ncbi:hypothetical protein N2152v2_005149 [Parachlorella kessleri]
MERKHKQCRSGANLRLSSSKVPPQQISRRRLAASAERVPSGDALPTATPVLQQPAAAVSPIHTRSVVHSELFHLSEVLETSLAMNASLEAELTAVRQEVEQARADAETYRSKLAQLTQQVQNALLPDAKPGDKACTNMSLLLRRFQSRLSNVRAAAASWKAKAKEAAAGDVEKAREEAAEQAGVADRLLASLLASVDPEQCSETQAPVDKRPRA